MSTYNGMFSGWNTKYIRISRFKKGCIWRYAELKTPVTCQELWNIGCSILQTAEQVPRKLTDLERKLLFFILLTMYKMHIPDFHLNSSQPGIQQRQYKYPIYLQRKKKKKNLALILVYLEPWHIDHTTQKNPCNPGHPVQGKITENISR